MELAAAIIKTFVAMMLFVQSNVFQEVVAAPVIAMGQIFVELILNKLDAFYFDMKVGRLIVGLTNYFKESRTIIASIFKEVLCLNLCQNKAFAIF